MFKISAFKKLYYTLIVIILICLVGVIGYWLIEGYNFHDAFFMTIITISTVGFQEIRPLSVEGRYFTTFLIIVSFGTFAYSATLISTYILDGVFRKHLIKLNKIKKIKEMENHIIICGYGRNGKQIIHELNQGENQYVLIENDPDVLEELTLDSNITFIEGDATEDQVLINAGIKKAKALITTLPDDAENVFVVLTAREMNNEMLIISRASKDTSDKKLRRAGANNVVMPDKVGGSHMVSLVVKPDVVEFFNHLTGQDNNISLEEITYDSLPEEFKNKSISDLHVRRRCGANIVGLKTKDGKYKLNPSPETLICEGSKLFVLGMNEQIEILKKWE